MDENERARKITELRDWFLGEIDRQLSVFAETFERFARSGHSPAEDDWRCLCRLAHNWKGSAGTYGFPELTMAAATLEAALEAREPVSSVRSGFERVLCVRAGLCSDSGER